MAYLDDNASLVVVWNPSFAIVFYSHILCLKSYTLSEIFFSTLNGNCHHIWGFCAESWAVKKEKHKSCQSTLVKGNVKKQLTIITGYRNSLNCEQIYNWRCKYFRLHLRRNIPIKTLRNHGSGINDIRIRRITSSTSSQESYRTWQTDIYPLQFKLPVSAESSSCDVIYQSISNRFSK